MEVSGQLHAPGVLPQGRKRSQYSEEGVKLQK